MRDLILWIEGALLIAAVCVSFFTFRNSLALNSKVAQCTGDLKSAVERADVVEVRVEQCRRDRALAQIERLCEAQFGEALRETRPASQVRLDVERCVTLAKLEEWGLDGGRP